MRGYVDEKLCLACGLCAQARGVQGTAGLRYR